MKVSLVGSLALGCALALIVSFSGVDKGRSQTNKDPSSTALSEAERDLFNEINQARAYPQVYASYLEKLKPLFNGKEYRPAGKESLTTVEGWSAVEDAIKFLRVAKPPGPLGTSRGLCLAALALVREQSSSGATGHKANDSSFIEQRVKPFGTWEGGIGEILAYGNDSAREWVLTWLIDDGFPGRGHRNRLMSGNYKVAGVSCGPHPEYQTMCVVTLAGGFIDSQTTEAAPTPQTNTAKPSNKSKPAKTKTTKVRAR